MKDNYSEMWSEWKTYNENMLNMWKKVLGNNLTPPTPDKDLAKEVEDWMKRQETMLSFYKQWYDSSKEMLKLYKPEVMTNMLPQEWAKSSEKMLGFWNDAFNQQKTWGMQPFDKFQDLLGKTYKDMFPNVSVKETFERLMKTMDVYNQLHAYWLETIKKMPARENQEAWEKYVKESLNAYRRINESFSQTFIPEQVKSMMSVPMENINTFREEIVKFFTPWLDEAGDLQKKLLLALQGDRNAYVEFQGEWSKLYESTYGKLLQIPAIGSQRETIEKSLKSMDSFIQYLFTLNEFLASMNKIGMGNMERLMVKLSKLIEEGKAPQSFKEFYKLWSQTNEEAYLELFATESYAKMLAETIDAGLRFKKGFDDMIQDQMASLPIPTRRELDNLEKSVYQLKRKVKEQSRTIDELLEKLEEMEAKAGRNL